MPTVNQVLENEHVSHAISLEQYKVGVARRMISLLNQTDASLAAALAEALERLPPESFTVERLEVLLASVRELNAAAYASVSTALAEDLLGLAEYESDYQFTLLSRTVPASVQVYFPIARIAPAQVYAAVLARPFQGRLLKDFGKELSDSRMAAIRGAIRSGYLEGKTSAEIVRKIRGTRADAYSDGLLQRPRRDLMSVVNTAISHTASVARDNFNQANSEIVKEIIWRSTLDMKTSEICRLRDGRRYTADTHKPIGHKVKWLQGPGVSHWNCRSTGVLVTKSWRELGIDLDQMSPKDRASMDGQVPAETKYSEWLESQSMARLERVVGVQRAKLMRDGELKYDQLYTPTGRYLTIDELRKMDAGEFRKAGI